MKIDVFKLEITLGNEAMQTAGDVADCLERLALRLRADDFRAGTHLFDINGNCVGSTTLAKRRV